MPVCGGLFSLHAQEIGKDKFRQIAAVTAFKHAEHRHAEGPQGLPKPLEIIRFQYATLQWVAGIRVEPGGHRNEIGPEPFQIVQRANQCGTIGFAWCGRHDRIFEAIVAYIRAAGTGLKGMSVDRKKSDAGPVQQDVFRTVAVVHVEIINGNAFGANRHGFQRGDRDII